MDAIWERWDLTCAEPEGCEELVLVLRALVWGYLLLAFMVFFVAIRGWTRQLPSVVGIAVAAGGSAVIVLLGRNYVGSTGNIQAAGIIVAVGLLVAWIGRPAFTIRKPIVVESVSRDQGHVVRGEPAVITDDDSSPSATH